MSKRMRADARQCDVITEALDECKGQLMCSSKSVSAGGKGRWAPTVIDVDEKTWTSRWKTLKKHPSFVRVGKNGAPKNGVCNGGTWFYWGDAPTDLIYRAGFVHSPEFVDVDMMLVNARALPAPRTRRDVAYGKRNNTGVLIEGEEELEEELEEVPQEALTEHAAAPPPETPAQRRPFTAPALVDRIPLTWAVLSRNVASRKSTSNLKGRTAKNDEKSIRLNATIEAMGEINATEMSSEEDAVQLLITIAEHLDVKFNMAVALKDGAFHTPRDLVEYKYFLKLRNKRMAPMVNRMALKGVSCTMAKYMEYFEELPYVMPECVKPDIDDGAARLVPYKASLVSIFESKKVHEQKMLDFGITDADGNKIVFCSFGADKANVNANTAVETALFRMHNLKRHVNAPHAAMLAYMGAHDESLRELQNWLPLLTKDMRDLHENGVSFECPGACCNACEQGVDFEPAGNGVRRLRHKLRFQGAIVSDQLWSRCAVGMKTGCCHICGYNSYEKHDEGDVGAGRTSFDPGYYSEINGSFAVAQAAWAEASPGDEDFFGSSAYKAWCGEHVGHVGPNQVAEHDGAVIVDDPVHQGLSLVAKAVTNTAVAFAVDREALDGTGVDRLLGGLREAGVPSVPQRREISVFSSISSPFSCPPAARILEN